MRCLVTGGCGFIGAALVHELLRGEAEVVVLDDLSVGSTRALPSDDRVHFERLDVRDGAALGALGRFDEVYHLAALHFVPYCTRYPGACYDGIVGGTRALLRALDAHGASARLFVASSAAVYGSSDQLHVETEALRPATAYGHAKARAEEMVLDWAGRRRPRRVAIGRYANAYGPGETNPHVIPSLVAQLAGGAARIRLARLDAERDFVHVSDLARGTVALLRHPAASPIEVLNFGSGRLCSIRRLVRLAERASGRRVEVECRPGPSRSHDPGRLGLDPARAAALIGWRAERQVEAGLAELLSAPKEMLEFVRWELAG